jgi:ligand-binding sensor domain-containing protein/signal transduction histidine kinase
MNRRRFVISALAMTVAIAAGSDDARAERLPARRYTAADGLPSDYVISIYRDSRGFLWFSTRDGLSRFDGAQFTNYGSRDGLPSTTINRVLETRAGVYWIATNGGGICRFDPRGRRPASVSAGESPGEHLDGERLLFTQYLVSSDPASNRVNVLYEDRNGNLWTGTDAGLFLGKTTGEGVEFRRVELPGVPASPAFHGVAAILEDSEGSLWIGGGFGLRRRLPDGRGVVYRVDPEGGSRAVNTLLLDRNQLWAGSRNGLLVLDIEPSSAFIGAHPRERTLLRSRLLAAASNGGTSEHDGARLYNTSVGLPADNVTALASGSPGRVWVGTVAGLSEFDGHRFRVHTTANGLSDDYIMTLAHDTAGNLWIGTVAGVTRLMQHGLVTYDQQDGLSYLRVQSLSQDESGRLFAVTGDYSINEFNGTRFRSVRPDIPRDTACTWLSNCAYLDRGGEWWVLSTTGLYRLPKVTRLEDLSRQRTRDAYQDAGGLPAQNAFRIFEDRQGDIWVGTMPEGLVRWQRSTSLWRVYSVPDGLPAPTGTLNMVTAFAEDRSGNLWIGFHNGGLARWHEGRFQMFGKDHAAPMGLISALHLDRAGRLWIGSHQAGLTRVDDPAAARPVFRTLTATSPNVRCLTEDARGRIYAGTSRGIDRLDPATGLVKHFGTGEGLASEFVTAALRDRQGMLWFGTISGLSKLDPAAPDGSTGDRPPQVFVSAVRVRGVPQPLSDLGDSDIQPLTLSPDQNQIEIEFFGITFNAGESVDYQYRIEGIDPDWSPPTGLRSVNYGRLPAGSHRFLVRSVRSDGAVSTRPAVVSFTVLPPVYARWWFILLSIGFASAAIVALYRVRVGQLVRVERVRARIATDLHDDIGASLSQIAILAEVARAGRPADSSPDGPLARIAETSRGLVDSMSDIVWAINPDVDSLSDLVHRMRRFAEDTLGAADVELTFREPELRQDPRLGPEIRREIFLMLKESVTNISKHAEATRVTIELERDRHGLRLKVTDDGRGFDPAQHTDGNGVLNMRRRAAALGGRLSVLSTPGVGTTIEIEVPL